MNRVKHLKSLETYKKWNPKVKIKTPITSNKKNLFMIKPMNKKGDMAHLMIALIMGFMAIAMLTALIPGFVEILDGAQNSEALNCVGYKYNGNAADSLSYNATIGTKSTIGCLSIKLYLPYLILAVLLGVVMYILYDKGSQQAPY
jgi:hypothetical protein